MAEHVLAGLSTCEISDALIKLGVTHGGYMPGLNRLSPSRDSEDVLSGPALTVQMVPSSDPNAPKLDQHFVDLAQKDTIMVIAAPLHLKNAVWGGLMTAGAQARGVLGVVISGRCRDLTEHRAAGFPVFARGLSTLGQSTFTRPSSVGDGIDIEGPSENTFVRVETGDWIVGDINGVVCVSQDLIEAVGAVARKGKAADERCMKELLEGAGVRATLKKWRQ
ncbi:RraA-like protein [Sistotremastrum niveocremeum HHB9708]|uniref:RraA-like protein n=2 Tax=Sistotremastraceae TaxID=3402574 RepID=A0A165AA23_9AGAM|nr:RraA-like protein [Sistotremastrum niveocremeum HHB9708]KZT42484.1 RraA-like protein [Sistotremastrum suecicum HHB10207 ss-3]